MEDSEPMSLEINSSNKPSKQTICLVMIVKNESKVIERCFNSVKNIIDYWVICDTGSTDGTQDIIKNYWEKEGIKGELYQHEWRNFGYNRTLAIGLAKGKCDYIITLDADEVFEFDSDFKMPFLDKDMYYIWTNKNNTHYQRLQLVSDKFEWYYKGVCHEYLTHVEKDGNNPVTQDIIPKMVNIPYPDGFRSSDPNKYKKDALLFEMALLDEPNNSRYIYYLAQSYRDCKEYDNAIKYYKLRVALVPNCISEETYYAQYQIGLCKICKDEPFENYAGDLLKAYSIRPSRLEAIHTYLKMCRINNLNYLGYQTCKHILERNNLETNDTSFLQYDIYKWSMFNELSLAACGAKLFKESIEIIKRILDEKKYPYHMEKILLHNLTTIQKIVNDNFNGTITYKSQESK
jgi:glycosyltransferase involved in cell wall biosynthesis